MWTDYLVWGLFVNAIKNLAGEGGLCSTMYDTLWVGNTFIQKLLFRNFSGLNIGSGTRIQRGIKPSQPSRGSGSFGICQGIKERLHSGEEWAGALHGHRGGLTTCSGQEGRLWSRLPWTLFLALHLLNVSLGCVLVLSVPELYIL